MASLPPASASSTISWGLLLGAAGLLEPAHLLGLVPAALIVDDVGAGAQHADHHDASARDENSVFGVTSSVGSVLRRRTATTTVIAIITLVIPTHI